MTQGSSKGDGAAKSVFELLKTRPEKRAYDPPADLPLDQTSGGSPPYDFPPELIHELANKSEEEVSSLLSKFRTGLSEHRTRLSEHRTDLSEHRTDLSDYRTELSGQRTDMSTHRTQMSEHRTALSDSRSHLANERTHLSYLRTSVALMSFGITINRFAIFLAEGKDLDQSNPLLLTRLRSTEQIGLGMVLVGVALLFWSLMRYRTVYAEIESGHVTPPLSSLTLLTLAIVVLGAATSIVLMLV